MTRDEYTEFIHMVFNYYNGKINIINQPAVLDINWLKQPQCLAGGWSHLPNIVKINPDVIITFNNYDWDVIKVNTVEVIIHELYHTDQVVDYRIMHVDEVYKNKIESACNMETMLYIADHQNEVSMLTGVDITKIDYNEIISYWDKFNPRYERRTILDHIILSIDNVACFPPDIIMHVINSISESVSRETDIVLKINDERLTICRGGRLLEPSLFNPFIGKYSCDIIQRNNFSMKYDGDTLIIDIEAVPMNRMCSIIDN